jgi:flagellar hook-associated protein 2
MASPITFGGLASGIDTNSIIDKLVEVERQPIQTLQLQRAQENARKDLLGDISKKLTALSSKFDALKTQSAVQGRKVDVPKDGPFGAEVQGAAPVGSYSIQVNQLAKAQRTYSNTFAGADTAGLLSAGTINLTIGGNNAAIAVTGTDTLNTVAQKINNSGLRLSAAVVYDGANYRMVVNGRDTGTTNAITITDGGTGLGLDVPANTVVAAQNAQITMDGIVVSSATNTISNSLPGVTLTLKSTSVAPITFSVTEDSEKLKTALKDIATAYNEVMSVLNKQFTSDGKKQLGPETLAGDSTARQMQATLLQMGTVTAGPAGNTFKTLTEIGINVDRYGTMSLDEARLDKALAADANAVSNLVAGSDTTNGAMKKLTDSLKLYTDFVDGALSVKQKTIDARIKIIDSDIERMESAATAYEQRIRQQFSQMEQLISSFQSQTNYLTQLSTNSSSNK